MTAPDKRLFCAANIRVAQAVRQAFAEGADPNVRQETGLTPLYWAVGCGDAEICRLLLEAGADAEALNEKGLTPEETCGSEI